MNILKRVRSNIDSCSMPERSISNMFQVLIIFTFCILIFQVSAAEYLCGVKIFSRKFFKTLQNTSRWLLLKYGSKWNIIKTFTFFHFFQQRKYSSFTKVNISTPPEKVKSLWSFDFFRGYKNGTPATNGLNHRLPYRYYYTLLNTNHARIQILLLRTTFIYVIVPFSGRWVIRRICTRPRKVCK